MFNVSFLYKLPFSKFCNPWCHAFGRLPFLLNQFESVPLYLEFLLILCAKFLPFDLKEKKNFKNSFKCFH